MDTFLENVSKKQYNWVVIRSSAKKRRKAADRLLENSGEIGGFGLIPSQLKKILIHDPGF